jgi:hypothetical protein
MSWKEIDAIQKAIDLKNAGVASEKIKWRLNLANASLMIAREQLMGNCPAFAEANIREAQKHLK